MTHIVRSIIAIAVASVTVALVGCHKEEGPAERAGKSIDNAVEQAGNKVENAGKDIQDSAKGRDNDKH